MHSIEVAEAKQTFRFPESATEFSRKQMIDFARLVLYYQSEHINFSEFKTLLTFKFLNLKRRADLSKETNAQIAENIHAISKLIDPYFTDVRKEGKTTKQLVMDFYLQKIPSFTIDDIEFFGPTDALFNTVYGEYLQMINHFTEYSHSQNISFLDSMIATIYRPKKEDYDTAKLDPDFDGDIRKPYNPNHTKHYASYIKKLSFDIKYAIYLFVASCQHFIANANALPIGGTNAIDLTILFEGNSSDEKNSLGMLGTLYALAETKVFGPVKDVAKQNTYDVLAYLVKQTQELNKLKSNATN